MAKMKVAVVIGSLRKDSLSRKIANALMALAPKALDCRIVEIGDLPLYNEDLEERTPAAWTHFRSDIKGADAILFVTPEYNRSILGCLKNAIDVGSRPQNHSVFDGMPAGVVSVTPYKLGAFGANQALRQTFVFLNMLVMQQPEAYIGGAAELFDGSGALKNTDTELFLTKFMVAFADWVHTIKGGATRESFAGFLGKRQEAAEAYVNGDAEPLNEIVATTGDATFFPPHGGRVHGAQAVAQRYRSDAGAFGRGGTSKLEILQTGAEGDIAFWTGVQTAKVRVGKPRKAVRMKLRITEIFRYRNGGWKMIHRHADTAADAPAD
ncbi:MAG TPA: NAD(P)H-dependent oxidoreductase [Rhizomicrobium sp.]|jgi:NAD(P)H-dependent FMN reductase/ketosteroid isomerase-like protein